MSEVAKLDEATHWYLNMLIGPHNPFDDRYVQRELRWYGRRGLNIAERVDDGVDLVIKQPFGQLPDFFNKNFRIEPIDVPTLFIDGKLWMSLTPMEVQSQFLAINNATGTVGVAGLGMGYAALKIAQKEEVESVTVFEIDPRVIGYFKRSFRRRKGYKKIRFVEGDARETVLAHGSLFDFLYVDIYQTMLGDEVIDDIKHFSSCVHRVLTDYHFWGQERVWVDAVLGHEILEGDDLPETLRALLTRWSSTPISTQGRLADTMLCDLYHPLLEEEFICSVLDAWGLVY